MDAKLGLSLAAAVAATAGLFSVTPPQEIPAAPAKEVRPVEIWEKHPAFPSNLSDWGGGDPSGVAIVAPSSGLKAGKDARAHEIAEALGVRFPQGALNSGLVPYNAVDDDTRADLLKAALNDPKTRVIWALRGGYGSSRILDEMASQTPPAKRKVFVGYSDATFLHQFFHGWGWPTVHGAMFWELSSKPEAKDWENFRRLSALLSGHVEELRYSGIAPLNKEARDLSSPIEGPVIGGNLTCLAASAGTPWALAGEGKIVFIEDVSEDGYKVDRMLTQLVQAGAFKGAEAVLFGDFTDGDEDVNFALSRFADAAGVPVFRSDLFGHGPKNYPLVLNAPSTIARVGGGEGEANGKEEFSLTIDARNLFEKE